MSSAPEKTPPKKLRCIQRSADRHWVGDGFPVRTLFSYPNLGSVLSPFLLLDYAGPREFPPTSKRLGVTDIVSVSAVGSLREHLAPGMFVIVDQFIDRTFAREKSFFGEGLVAHVSMARPVCHRLGAHLEAAAKQAGIHTARGGTYLVMEGPQFSTYAESELYRTWNCDVIGMTNMPEAKLAREAEICYATVAMVTDYDSWHADHGEVDIQDILRVLAENRDRAQRLIARLARDFPRERAPCPIGSDKALEHAILTAPDKRDPALVAKLDAVAGRVLKRG